MFVVQGCTALAEWYHVVPYRVVPKRVVPYRIRTAFCRDVLNRTVSRGTVSLCTVSYCAAQYHRPGNNRLLRRGSNGTFSPKQAVFRYTRCTNIFPHQVAASWPMSAQGGMHDLSICIQRRIQFHTNAITSPLPNTFLPVVSFTQQQLQK